MITSIKKFNPSRLAKLFFLFFLISVFFPIRYVFPTASGFATGLYSDFTSISLYSSDIFLFIAFIFTLWSNKFGFLKQFFAFRFSLFAFIIWLILATFIFNWPISGLNIWFFVKFIELTVVSYGTVQLVISKEKIANRNLFLLLFVCLGTLQSVIGLMQFINQSPIGLNLVGEQTIGPGLWGVAKIVSSGTAYIRAYGTFPHPNLLSAFLLTTIFFNIYLLTNKFNYMRSPSEALAKLGAKEGTSTTWNPAFAKATADQPKNKRWLLKNTKIWLNLALFINIVGLTATFSRGAFLALGVGLLIYFGFLIVKQGIRSNGWMIIKLLLAFGLAFLIFKPFLLTRATVSDQGIVEREIYNQTALNMIKDKPFSGIGIGESLLHMEQYSPVPLNPYQIQPIHNYFLLSAAELGIIGALILIWVFFSHLKALWLRIKDKGLRMEIHFLYFAILVSFFTLMNFDHYFYTLQQTQMLLWIVLGLIAAETRPQATSASVGGQAKNPQTGDLSESKI